MAADRDRPDTHSREGLAAARHAPLRKVISNWNRRHAIAFLEQIRNSETHDMNRSTHENHTDNPKLNPHPADNTEKPPEDWVSGGDPMTGAQTSYLKTLSEQTGQPEQFDQTLSKAEASKRIDTLKARLQD